MNHFRTARERRTGSGSSAGATMKDGGSAQYIGCSMNDLSESKNDGVVRPERSPLKALMT